MVREEFFVDVLQFICLCTYATYLLFFILEFLKIKYQYLMLFLFLQILPALPIFLRWVQNFLSSFTALLLIQEYILFR